MGIREQEESIQKNVEVFCCYARKDQSLLLELKTHLTPLQRERLITLWADIDINAGMEWEEEIHRHLNSAQIILLLISPDFIASEYCFSVEMQRAMERHESGEARVIPIILRAVSWQRMPFGKFQALPNSANPIMSGKWHHQDEAFYEVVEGIRDAVSERLRLAEEERVRNLANVERTRLAEVERVKTVEGEGRLTEPEIDKSKIQTNKKQDENYFDKLTEQARKVLSLAREEAQRFQHNYIGTEHLLLGLIRENKGVAAKALSGLGVELNKVRSATEFIIGRGDRIIVGEIGLTPRAKKVIDLAMDEARRLDRYKIGPHYIGPEHLLLGIVREGEGIAAGVLESLGVNLENIRAQTMEVLRQTVRDARPSETPIIDQMGVDLTREAIIGKISPIIGRHQEMERITQILCRRNKNNPVLIGKPGVGKTTIGKGLAQRLADGEVPEIIADKRLLTLDLGVLSRTMTRWSGEAEQQLQKILEEVRNDCILFIDDLPRLFGTNINERVIDVAQLFKLALSRGELQCLGTSTPEAYESMIKQDVALQAWFEKVQVGVMTVEETIGVLEDIREEYEQHYRLVIYDEALKAAAELAGRYISDLSLPGKAIALLDAAASRVSVRSTLQPLGLKEATKGLESVLRAKEQAIQQQEYELAAELRGREVKLRDRIAKLESAWHHERGSAKPAVGEEEVAQIVLAEM